MDSSADLEELVAAVEVALLKRWPESRINPTMDRIAFLCDALGSPQLSYPTIHVGGTNGKTSTTRMIDSLMRALDFRTGRFTSPHLESILERISINNEPITPEGFIGVYNDIALYLDLTDERHDHPVSFFEAITAMAFVAFAEFPVDIGIIEVGMGGEWDATNVVNSAVSVIAPIGFDHMEYLGNTLEEIAQTKAGIIKPGSNVVLAAQEPAVAKILLERAGMLDATPFRQGVEFGLKSRALAYGGQQISLAGIYGSYDEIFLPLYGAHQAENASLALAAVEAFVGKELDIEAVRLGFANATSPGRLEIGHSDPTVLIDAAHNPHGAIAASKTLRDEFDFAALYGVIAMLSDKDVKGFLEIMEPVLDRVIITTNSSPRAMSVAELEKVAVSIFGADRVSSEPTLDRAISRAIEETSTLNQVSELSNGVVVTGSVITAGEAKTILRRR